MWKKLKNAQDFSESNIKNSCISESTLILNGCINEIFNQTCHEEVSEIQKTGLQWSNYARHLREFSFNGLPYWLTGIFLFH